MIALAIILGLALAASIGGDVAMGLWLRSSTNDRVASIEDKVTEQRRGDQLLKERDDQVAANAELVAENAELKRRLEAAELQRNAAAKENADHVADSIRNAPSAADALAALNLELLPHVSEAAHADPTAAGGAHGAATAVQPVAGSVAGDPHGHG